MRYYLPDFVGQGESGMFLVETKGMEEVNVPIKDREALRWCENVQKLSGKTWNYLKVRSQDFETYRSQDFQTLSMATVQTL